MNRSRRELLKRAGAAAAVSTGVLQVPTAGASQEAENDAYWIDTMLDGCEGAEDNSTEWSDEVVAWNLPCGATFATIFVETKYNRGDFQVHVKGMDPVASARLLNRISTLLVEAA